MKIAITGMGLVTSLGKGVDVNWQKLTSGESGVKKISRFNTDQLKTVIGACIDFYGEDGQCSAPQRTYYAAEDVLNEALKMSGSQGLLSEAPLFFATPTPEADWNLRQAMHDDLKKNNGSANLDDYEKVTRAQAVSYLYEEDTTQNGIKLADRFSIGGSVVTLTTACASGGSAVQLAVDAIRRGETDIAVVVGADAGITQDNISRFSLLSALSTKNDEVTSASKPFDIKRDGFVMGEGAGALILESADHAKARGAKTLGYVLGCGSATDNFHKTRSNPSGEFIQASMQSALDDAGIVANKVGYINAHGTSTPENDKMESLGIELVFADIAKSVCVSSTKSMLGHTLCAAGTIEAIISLLALNNKMVPPNINITEMDPKVSLNIVQDQNIPPKSDVAMSNSFGFGGQNVSIIVASGEYDHG